MSTSCISTATATTTSVTTVESTLTTFTESVSTQTPTVTTITTEECELGALSDVACVSTTSTITSTIPGTTTTIQVPVTETVPVSTETQTFTLFGSSCTIIPTSVSGSVISSGSANISLSQPTPFVTTSQSATTLANGQITIVPETIMFTPPPSTIYINPSTTAASDQTQNNTDSSSSPHIGVIVGSAVGGFFGLLGLALIIWFIMKRRRRWDDIFDKEDSVPRGKRFSLDAEVEPKPYQYGLVGQTRSPSVGISPPSSPPAFSPPGRQHTLSPLYLPTSASTPGPSATTMSSRPSTAGSMRPLRDPPPPGSPPVNSGHTHNHTTSSGSSTSVHIAPAMPSHWGHHSPSLSAGQEYFERPGSPTSVRDYEPQRRLHLANVGSEDVQDSPPSASPLTDPALLDGKGRHVRLGSGGPGVLVHTDAGPVPDG
ncbi:hypothetical protein B0H11DRAFT_2024216, partial [Mycena galericulata]